MYNVKICLIFTSQEKHLENETVQLQCVRLLPNTQVKISHIYDTSTVYVQMADKTSLDTIEEILQEIGSYCQTGMLRG